METGSCSGTLHPLDKYLDQSQLNLNPIIDLISSRTQFLSTLQVGSKTSNSPQMNVAAFTHRVALLKNSKFVDVALVLLFSSGLDMMEGISTKNNGLGSLQNLEMPS